MKTLREVLKNLNQFAENNPNLLDTPCVFVDGQCGHYPFNGVVFEQDTESWPTEYCLQDDISTESFLQVS
jgi:hypothetical protein